MPITREFTPIAVDAIQRAISWMPSSITPSSNIKPLDCSTLNYIAITQQLH